MEQSEAALRVLIEIMNVLGDFRSEIVIVGGWVPELKYPDKNHIGSLDVDLAISPQAVGPNVYSTILQRLVDKDYDHRTGPTHFLREVQGASQPVKVDLISGEYGSGTKSRTIRVDELNLNCLRGLDLAFDCCEEIAIEGTMPDGTHNTVRARIVRPEAFVLIKAFALADRIKKRRMHTTSPSSCIIISRQ